MRLEKAVAVVFEPDHSITPELGLIPRTFSGSGTGLGMRLPRSVKWSLWEIFLPCCLSIENNLFCVPTWISVEGVPKNSTKY